MLVSAGQPLFTEDTWWHLSMGERYAAEGPWLSADPLLHTATGPPAPAAWLTALGLHGVERLAGIQGLRCLHALLVLGILLLAWRALRRASGSTAFASLATAAFAALSAYRLFQLRPHLFTIGGALLLVWLLVGTGRVPSWRRVAAAVLGMLLWANLHGAFVLGPILLAAGVAGLALAALLEPGRRPLHLARAKRIAIALVLGLVATLANPQGMGPHRLYFAAGTDTPALEVVRDEWLAVPLFSLPTPNLPPSPLSWALVWALLVLVPAAVVLTLRAQRRKASTASSPAPTLDPALVAIAAVSLVGALSAVRLLWMEIFPLMVLGQCLQPRLTGAPGDATGTTKPRTGAAWTLAAVALLLLPGFVALGDWPMISRAVRAGWYARPYPTTKYDAFAVWFLRDAGLTGRLFNDYTSGNFLGYWLAPGLRVFVNGSLNVPKEVLDAHGAILRREGLRPGESFEQLLDRYGIDVFFGTGLPQLSLPGRPLFSTTAYLEGRDGWILVFRNVRSAVYLRDDERNRPNLERVADYYAREGVPFDAKRGLDPARVIREDPEWAVLHGVVPRDFRSVQNAAHSFDPTRRGPAQERLAALYAALGLYDSSIAEDRRLLSSNPASLTAARRLVWSLLRLHRYAEAARAAAGQTKLAAADDPLSRLIATTAQEAAGLAEAGRGEEAATRVARLPVFTLPQAQYLLAGYHEAEPRVR